MNYFSYGVLSYNEGLPEVIIILPFWFSITNNQGYIFEFIKAKPFC